MKARIEGQTDWETRLRPRVAIIAAIGGILSIGCTITRPKLLAGQPRTDAVDSLARLGQKGSIETATSLHVDLYKFLESHAPVLLLLTVFGALSYLAAGYVIWFLAKAAQARDLKVSKITTSMPLVGSGILAAVAIIGAVVLEVLIHSFLGGARTVAAANAVSSSWWFSASQLVGLFGAAALGFGLISIARATMRTGLLTRFLGSLGVGAGVLVLISALLPQNSQLGIIQSAWLLLVAVLLFGRWRGGMPKAWITGNPEPWVAIKPPTIDDSKEPVKVS